VRRKINAIITELDVRISAIEISSDFEQMGNTVCRTPQLTSVRLIYETGYA